MRVTKKMFKNKKVLVAGGVGLIGRQLVELLLSEGADVFVSDLRTPDSNFLNKVKFFIGPLCLIRPSKVSIVRFNP